MATVEELVKNALSEYDFQEYLDEFFTGDIDWVRDNFAPLIKNSLEKVLKKYGKSMIKDVLSDMVFSEVSEVEIKSIVKEILLEKISTDKLIERILK